MTKVALSGASGNIGRILCAELPRRGIDLRCGGGRRPLVPLHEGEDIMHGATRRAASLFASRSERAAVSIM